MIYVSAKNYRELKEELELVEEIDHLRGYEFCDLCESLTREQFKAFQKWLEKWGLI